MDDGLSSPSAGCGSSSSDIPAYFNSSVQYDRYGFYGGKEYTDPESEVRVPIKVLRARELKWREMCHNWEWWATKNALKLRERCRKGIPDSMRCEAWQRLCGSPMVLVARPKVIAMEMDPAKKQRYFKGLFGTLSKSTNSRSLPTVITTSPSFRIRRGKADERTDEMASQLPQYSETGNTSPALSQLPGYQSLRSTGRGLPVLTDSGNGDADNLMPLRQVGNDATFRWSQAGSNGDSAERNISGPDSGSFHSLVYSGPDSAGSVPPQPIMTYATYTASVCVHETSRSSIPEANYATAGSEKVAVASSSGGYASLSTNSGTDSMSMRNTPNQPPGNLSTDSYASSLHSCSVASSSSMLWHPSRVSEAAHSIEPTDLEDARATLVPVGDPDPVALYEHYCMQEGVPSNCDQIRRDIDRQFPFHEIFSNKGGHGQESLYTLLKAYTIRHADKGYCQGQAPLAAVLLMFMPEVDAFWTFNEVCERYLEAYYDDGLERIQIDGEILYALIKSSHPSIYKYLKKNNVEPVLIVLEWFMCVFTRTLPWTTVLRVLDMFFCEGKVVLFRVAIVLLQRMFGTQALRKACPGIDDILVRLRDVQSVVKNSEEFVRETVRIALTPREVAQEARRQSRKWERNKQLKAAAITPVA
ncbi:TBC1 domain member 10A [Clonorchis sinensis]|uniref:TBC1 domain member 10A n=1 Tax=Clonorchis sinensis TaxID=79923 RepID=A0A8T1MSY7_CLOSI|nr:TBC1 domain member 10A [Clonorchis sinensis]